MRLFYDSRDEPILRRTGSRHLQWLKEVGAAPLGSAERDEEGFVFAGARPIEDYRRLLAGRSQLRDRPEEREPLLRLDSVLDALAAAGVRVPTPRTWRLELDAKWPEDLRFPLFVRTAVSSWKLGGRISRVTSPAALRDECEALRRAFGWDATILAREWIDLAPAGRSVYGPVAQEVRVWVVDGQPYAWSFHYLNVVRQPEGFPPSEADLAELSRLASAVASAFRSRLVVADFARLKSGKRGRGGNEIGSADTKAGSAGEWVFIEAGPGSCAGTGHERVYKAVVRRLVGQAPVLAADATGGGMTFA